MIPNSGHARDRANNTKIDSLVIYYRGLFLASGSVTFWIHYFRFQDCNLIQKQESSH